MICSIISIILLLFAYGKDWLVCLIIGTILALSGLGESMAYGENGFMKKASLTLSILCTIACLIKWAIIAFS